jgi:hypothetical protein
MKKGGMLVIILMIYGCSLLNESKQEYTESKMTNVDYLEHFKSLGDIYLKSKDNKEIVLDELSNKYLKNTFKRLVNNNEIIFKTEGELSFHVVKNKTPFLFSLPGDRFFFSTGLFEKYLKSEELFVSAFAAEIIKSKKNIFEKKSLIPLGFVSTEKMIQLTRVDLEIKKSINEWAFVLLKRAGFDSSAYLNWIQVQNRNSLDFAMYLGDSINIVSEEQLFKNYMSKQGLVILEKKTSEANSSKEFYKLLKNINKAENESRTIRKNSSRRII